MIAGVAEDIDEAYTELAGIAEPGMPVAILGNNPPDDHPDWMAMQRMEGFQMTCDTPIEYEEMEFEILTPVDVPQMMELVELTKPGPFSPRTIEMGEYIGVKVDGKLVAMGGERMKPEGHIEISAICTHPEHRGKGYAKAITGALTNMVLERGETPFLYVIANNTPAIKLYEKLGYKTRRTIRAAGMMRKPMT
jgi:predicted GNAT family acetyltransferase